MAAPDEELILSGGTLSDGAATLGTLQAVTLRRVGVIDPITAEEYGGETAKPLLLRQVWSVGAVLRNWDADAINRAFLNVTGGQVDWPSTIANGYDLTASGFVLTHTPTDTTNGKGFTLYHATPALIDTEILFSGREELSLEIGFLGLRDGSDQIVRITA